MKKVGAILFTLVFSIFLVGCNLSEENQADASFTGTIAEINDDSALIDIEEGEIRNSGNQVIVDLSIVEDEEFAVGDKVRVGYNGGVMESYPLQITTAFVEKVDD